MKTATVELLCFARIRADRATGTTPFRKCMDLAAKGELWAYLDAQLAAGHDAYDLRDQSTGEIQRRVTGWLESWVSANAGPVLAVEEMSLRLEAALQILGLDTYSWVSSRFQSQSR